MVSSLFSVIRTSSSFVILLLEALQLEIKLHKELNTAVNSGVK